MNQSDIINFLTQFLPALVELDLRVERIEEELELRGRGGGNDQADEEAVDGAESGELDLFGMKLNLKDMLAKHGGDPAALKNAVEQWKAKHQPTTPAASSPSSTPSTSTPTNGNGGSS